jgi:hypothetical protein
MRIFHVVLLLILSVSVSLAKYEVLASCSDAKAELLDLNKEKTNGYEKDSMSLEIIGENDKIYVKRGNDKTELYYLGGNQMLEEVKSGHNVLYTLHDKFLTIQKSQDFLGMPVMINIYLKCK